MRVIGVMSGSSLDGIDVACCTFEHTGTGWEHRVLEAETVPYDTSTQQRLADVTTASAMELAHLHNHLGRLIGEACAGMARRQGAELVASHGHTVFHQPGEGFTTQIGCGATIAVRAGVPVVCDFRTTDVAHGGQGAPLVPLGERELWPEHHAFLNLGGIANLSIHQRSITGYDISPCNQALNQLAMELGQAYDTNGELARSGRIDDRLLHALDALPFYALKPPRSLGREWYEEHLRPLIMNPQIALADRARTTVEHVGRHIGKELDRNAVDEVLVSGGGAHNGFLVERIRSNTKARISIPSKAVIDLKEAIIFAFLGLLRWRGEVNVLASVTGASQDSVGGAVYLPG